MKKKSTLSNSQPLAGTRILVGRARHQAGALSVELKRLGATVLEIPFIEIRKPRSFAPLDAALNNLAGYDWLILTSVNGVEAMWERMEKLKIDLPPHHRRQEFSRAPKSSRPEADSAAAGLRVAAIGPATKKAIEQRGAQVDVVPKEYIAESVVRSLRRRVKGKRVLLVRAKIARDVIPRELRKAGAQVNVVEAYETVVPESSRKRLQDAITNPLRRPQVIAFTSSSSVRNFVNLLGTSARLPEGMRLASIGPVTSATLRHVGLRVDFAARKFDIPGLVQAIVRSQVHQKLRSK